MKAALQKAYSLFKYVSLVFSVGYFIYVIIDDYVLLEDHWSDSWPTYLAVWTMYYVFYFVIFAFYYWAIASVVSFVYAKLWPRAMRASE